MLYRRILTNLPSSLQIMRIVGAWMMSWASRWAAGRFGPFRAHCCLLVLLGYVPNLLAHQTNVGGLREPSAHALSSVR